jgi:hypothetical protein
MYAVAMYNHTSSDKGDRKENRSASCLTGLENRILIPEEIFRTKIKISKNRITKKNKIGK